MDDRQTYDFVIVGSGAGAITAALVAARAGRSVVIVEKSDKIGGSCALSGGVAWIPNNPVARRAGMTDSEDRGLQYLNACAGPVAPGSTLERRAAYVREGAQAVDFLESLGMKFRAPKGYSDYYESVHPGAVREGRAIVAEPYDLRKLGGYAERLLRWPKVAEQPVAVDEFAQLSISGRTLQSKLTYLRVGSRLLRRKLGAQLVAMGGAWQGRLLEIALSYKIQILTRTAFQSFLMEGDRLVGINVSTPTGQKSIRAGRGVLLNAGGFARNPQMRAQYQPQPATSDWTLSNPGDTGEVLAEAMKMGAATHLLDFTVWTPVTILPGGAPVFNLTDMSKPHAILVDSTGARFVNEGTSYVEIGVAMYERHKTVPAIPSWIVMDSVHRHRYFLAGAKAGKPSKEWLESGTLIEANSLEELAAKCGMKPGVLEKTVLRFNAFATEGVDHDFGRGKGAWHRFFGDPTVRPNAALGTIARPPFYAMKAHPGDVGTFGGLVTDEYGRVLKKDGTVIDGLYAAGNITAPVTGPSYPGAGASIGPALVFGYIAARHALGDNEVLH